MSSKEFDMSGVCGRIDHNLLTDPITLKAMENPVIDKCGHTFDLTSILRFAQASPQAQRDQDNVITFPCPLSRAMIRTDQLVPNLLAVALLEELKENKSPDQQRPKAPLTMPPPVCWKRAAPNQEKNRSSEVAKSEKKEIKQPVLASIMSIFGKVKKAKPSVQISKQLSPEEKAESAAALKRSRKSVFVRGVAAHVETALTSIEESLRGITPLGSLRIPDDLFHTCHVNSHRKVIRIVFCN